MLARGRVRAKVQPGAELLCKSAKVSDTIQVADGSDEWPERA